MMVVAGLALQAWADAVEWEFPRTGNCHEGMPFSDGVTGVLVWGGDDTINLTVGRADLWDHRGGYPRMSARVEGRFVREYCALRRAARLGSSSERKGFIGF